MLQGENRCRHKHGHLLSIDYSLESRADSKFGLAKADIATDKPIHRHFRFHIGFYQFVGLALVGCILVHKRRFQLDLHVRVGRKCKAFLLAPFCIKQNQVACYILDILLGALLQSFPMPRAKTMNHRRFAILVAVL